jgi:hypothetical protein
MLDRFKTGNRSGIIEKRPDWKLLQSIASDVMTSERHIHLRENAYKSEHNVKGSVHSTYTGYVTVYINFFRGHVQCFELS